MPVKITIIYDNTSISGDLHADWGFACLIETGEKTILFDTGAKGDILLHNMERLNISPKKPDTVFISHDHWDHVDGLPAFLEKNPDVTIYVPESFKSPTPPGTIRISEQTELAPGIWSTGELESIEQSLVIGEKTSLTIIAGCSHPGVSTILEAASRIGKVDNLAGGLHGFSDFSALEPLAKICPTHCTEYIDEIKNHYPEKYIPGGAGTILIF